MQKTMNIILKAAAALLAVTLAASCVFEKEEPSQTQQKYKYVLVQLGVNTDKMTATKADGDVVNASDADGNDVETAIKDLKVYAYTLDASNNKVLRGYLSTQNVNAAATATQPLLMDIKVPFEEYGSTQQVYFMAVANAGGMTGTGDVIINSIGRAEDGSLVLPESFGFDDFASIRYSVADQTFANGMPMYCQTSTAVTVNLAADGTANTAPGHNGHTNLPVKVTLDMTRSLSKIEVYAAEDAATTGTSNAGIKITGVQLVNVIADGPLFPATASTTALSPAPAMTVSTADIAAGVADADKTDASKYTKATNAYYLAENAAGTTGKFSYGEYTSDEALETAANGATALKIGYKVGSGEQKYGYVVMPPIVRNTWYKVLARIKANGQMALELNVLPWNDTEEQVINFADNVSLNGPISWSGNGAFAGSTFSFSGSNANLTANCTFTLDAPQAGTWYVSLTDGDISNFQLETTGSTVPGNTVSGPIVPGQAVVVSVKTLTNNYLQGTKTAKLQITARRVDGTSLIVRHGSGADAQDAYFTIVQPQN